MQTTARVAGARETFFALSGLTREPGHSTVARDRSAPLLPIIVNSPHSGRPVKVRDQDVGRAVRDEAGRIFFVLPTSDGNGHYGSKTRKGGSENPQRQGQRIPDEGARPGPEADAVVAAHDVTGRRRARGRGKLYITALVIILAVLAYLFSPYGPFSFQNFPRGTTPKPNPLPVGPTAEPGTGAS